MKLSKILIVHLFVLYVFVGMAQATIDGSKHDLAGKFGTEDNGEICSYCHTPHGADSAFTGAPLWNKGQPTSTFTLYGSTIATTTTDATVNSQSMACLSCHDGVSAVNSVVNAPGSGLATANGDQLIGDTLNEEFTIASALLSTSTVTNIGTDLTNDHPVSIEYIAGRASLRATTTDLATATGVTWSGATTIGDLLRGSSRVECGSCHDPHMGENPTFLRVPDNAGSALCIGCHGK